MEEKTINDLIKIGFIKVGIWKLNTDNEIKFEIENQFLEIEHLLYAFESDEKVRYIGITEGTLNIRMTHYKNAKAISKTVGSTNLKVNKCIKELLILKNQVSIYMLKNDAPCDYYGFSISLATGIEKSLISAFDNSNLWNKRGVKIDENKRPHKKTKTEDNHLKNNQSILKLGSYALEGWLIFKKDIDHLLPGQSDDVKINYKDEVIQGKFTRSKDNKKTNGYKRLKEIFNKDFKLGDYILVTILNPNEVVFEKYQITMNH